MSLANAYMVELSRLRGLFRASLTADQTVNNQATLQPIVGFAFPIAPNEIWLARAVLLVGDTLSDGSGGGTGISVGYTMPSGCTGRASAALFSGMVYPPSGQGTPFTAHDDGTIGTGSGFINWDMWFKNGKTAGTITLKFAQADALLIDTKVHLGSTLRAERLA